jgi:two-component system, chemotaxis family, sensor kinase Cph1
VSLVLGDVAGHGLAAAAITAQLRHALRAHLLRAAGPAAALDGLNQVIGALLPGELATAVVVELDPATGEVVVANAGHLPVLHTTAGGADYLDEGRGPSLGLLDAAGYRETRVQLAGEDCLPLFSDGLVERRPSGLTAGLEWLRDAVRSGPADPQELLDAVLRALDPPRADDVTLLAVART